MTTTTKRPGALSRLATTCLAAALFTTVVAAAPVQASVGRERQHGSCQGPGHWTLGARHQSGHLRLRFAVTDVDPHETWQVFLSDNGVRIRATSRVSGSRGSFRVRTPTHDRRGADHISATAVNAGDGGSCQASLIF
jgi:hypothetical protein